MEYSYENLPANLFGSEDLKEWKTFDLYQSAHSISINLPAPRVDAYLSSNYDHIQETVVSFANPIFFQLGWNSVCPLGATLCTNTK